MSANRAVCPKTHEICPWRQALVQVRDEIDPSFAQSIVSGMGLAAGVYGAALVSGQREQTPQWLRRIDAILATNCVENCIVRDALSANNADLLERVTPRIAKQAEELIN